MLRDDMEGKKRYDWWRASSIHLWRTYFYYVTTGQNPGSIAQQKIYVLCDKIFQCLPDYEKKFLQEYYACPWNTDREFVSDYASRTGISEVTLWRAVHDSGRELFVKIGLLDPKE